MRLGNLVGIVAMISGSLAACSRPASNNARAARDIDLPASPASEAAVLSTLEAGKAVPLSPVHQPAHRASASASTAAPSEVERRRFKISRAKIKPVLLLRSWGMDHARRYKFGGARGELQL